MWGCGLFGHFGTGQNSINPFGLTHCLCTIERFPIVSWTGEVVWLLLSMNTIVLLMLSMMETTVNPFHKDCLDGLAVSNEVLISRQRKSILELTIVTPYTSWHDETDTPSRSHSQICSLWLYDSNALWHAPWDTVCHNLSNQFSLIESL